jgi:transposase InsO family protein
VRKVWRQMRREGFDIARCTVARLMKSMGIQGIIRGKPHRTTIPDKKAPCPLDKVNRQFRVPAPNMLWVSDFTDVAPRHGHSDQWRFHGSIIDAYARRIVAGGSAPRHMRGSFSMPWNRPCMTGGPPRGWDWFIIRTAARNI